jgi:pimeloyl-ACP methyl ester carboxylesterase
MAKLMSKKTKETVITIMVLVVIVVFVASYIVYPLIKIPDLASRPDREAFEDPDYAPENEPGYFAEAGYDVSPYTIVSQDNINLAALQFMPDSTVFDSIKGMVILNHPDDTDRTAMADMVKPLLDSGLAVILYDMRACGLSGGIWHFAGDSEGDDLIDIIHDLSIRDRLTRPLFLVGFNTGGDAVIKASREESRIDKAIVVDPYLTRTRWMAGLIEKHSAWPVPVDNMVYYWWYQKI